MALNINLYLRDASDGLGVFVGTGDPDEFLASVKAWCVGGEVTFPSGQYFHLDGEAGFEAVFGAD